MNVPEALACVGTAYVVLTYLAHKLFPRAENVRANDPRLKSLPNDWWRSL